MTKEEILKEIERELNELKEVYNSLPEKFKDIKSEESNQGIRLESSISVLEIIRNKINAQIQPIMLNNNKKEKNNRKK